MRKLLLLLAMGLLVSSVQANAQCNPDPNEIGIFWSPDCGACENCLDFLGGLATAYVVLANLTQPGGVHGFEFCLTNADGSLFLPPPGVFVIAYNLPENSFNVFDPPCFTVGLSSPLPWSPCITLLTVDILVFDPAPWCFGVRPNDIPSIPGYMAFADGDDPGLILPMYPNTGPGAPNLAMACLNSPDCPPNPVATEESSCGSLKSLYR